MPHVTPGRFSAKTDDEAKIYSLDWRTVLGTQTITDAKWASYPNGLAFSEQEINGSITQAKIAGGVAGTAYRIRVQVTLSETGEVLEASEADVPGIPLEVLGFPVVSGGLGMLRDDYGRGPY